MCTVLLPPGGYPIAVNKYIIYHFFYQYDDNFLELKIKCSYGHAHGDSGHDPVKWNVAKTSEESSEH